MNDEENEDRPLVDDPEDFAQRERLKQIYQARREFLEARAEAPQLRREREWGLPDYCDYILNAVQRYFFEVEGLMRRHPEGDYYLEEVPLGAVRAPGSDRGEIDVAEEGVVDDVEGLNEEDRVFVGLEDIATGYQPMKTRGYTTDSRRGEISSQTVLVTVPDDVSMRAYRQINNFLAEVGLDADMEGDTEEAEYDYSDLLQEGPPESDGEAPEIVTDGRGEGE